MQWFAPADFPPPAESRRVWTVFLAFVVALIAGLLGGGTIVLILVTFQANGHFETTAQMQQAIAGGIRTPWILLTSGACTQAMLLLTVIAAAMLSPIPLDRRLRLNPSSLSPLGYCIAPLGALSISFLFGSLVSLLGIPEGGTLKMLGDAFTKLSPLALVAALAIVGIGPGIAEECLFRGYIQTRLVQRWGRWVGIPITALLFGIMHMDLIQGTFAVGFGVYIGYLMEKSGSIRPGMVCHAFNNGIEVLLGRYLTGSNQQTPRSSAMILALASLAVLIASVLYIRYRVFPKPEADIGFPVLPPAEPQPLSAIVYPPPA